MKNSTKPKSSAYSSDDPRVSCKSFTRVGGIVFSPTKAQVDGYEREGVKLIRGIDTWREQKFPDNVVILDYAGALSDWNIPVLDAVYRNGVYHLSHAHRKPGEAKISVSRIRSKVVAPADFSESAMRVLSDDGVVMVDPSVTEQTSGKGKMSRGAGHRAKK